MALISIAETLIKDVFQAGRNSTARVSLRIQRVQKVDYVHKSKQNIQFV